MTNTNGIVDTFGSGVIGQTYANIKIGLNKSLAIQFGGIRTYSPMGIAIYDYEIVSFSCSWRMQKDGIIRLGSGDHDINDNLINDISIMLSGAALKFIRNNGFNIVVELSGNVLIEYYPCYRDDDDVLNIYAYNNGVYSYSKNQRWHFIRSLRDDR